MVLGKWDTLPLRTLEKALLEKGIADPGTLKVLDKASVRILFNLWPCKVKTPNYLILPIFQVPIVKLIDRATEVKVDISFNTRNGVQSAELIRHFKRNFLLYFLMQAVFSLSCAYVWKRFIPNFTATCIRFEAVSFTARS